MFRSKGIEITEVAHVAAVGPLDGGANKVEKYSGNENGNRAPRPPVSGYNRILATLSHKEHFTNCLAVIHINP